jgi:hypothetical protein
MSLAESDPERYAAARDEIMRLIQNGMAIDLLNTYSSCKQSCNYVYGILYHVAHDESDTICNGAKNMARNLLDDWSK